MRPAAPARPARAFPQREGASLKQLTLFALMRARAVVLAAVQGVTASLAERPLRAGGWNVRETVLHLSFWDRACAGAVERAMLGFRPPWHGATPADDERMNAEGLAPIRHLGWDEALRRLHACRQELLDAIESVPDEPEDPWSEGHALRDMLHELPHHDLHHAEHIKRWRAEQGV